MPGRAAFRRFTKTEKSSFFRERRDILSGKMAEVAGDDLRTGCRIIPETSNTGGDKLRAQSTRFGYAKSSKKTDYGHYRFGHVTHLGEGAAARKECGLNGEEGSHYRCSATSR
ncbi:hypothetical protein Zmor_009445 [Zophobas morio]|uniref:Uncharacterized protein n=1 Tax=Zophobas morio TaxID=2755281 RepID=A0AA38IGT9_9CUCU|nr:hypothetical protein Zmor_009445 [Zophobas morio]